MYKFDKVTVKSLVTKHLVLCAIALSLVVGIGAWAIGYAFGVRSSGELHNAVDDAWYVNVDFDDTGYRYLSDGLISDYGDLLEGKELITVGVVDYTMPGKLYAKTYSGSVGYEFDNKAVTSELKPGDIITIAGVMSDDWRHGPTVKHCEIIGFGEIVDELKSDVYRQRSYLDAFRSERIETCEFSVSKEVLEQIRGVRLESAPGVGGRFG